MLTCCCFPLCLLRRIHLLTGSSLSQAPDWHQQQITAHLINSPHSTTKQQPKLFFSPFFFTTQQHLKSRLEPAQSDERQQLTSPHSSWPHTTPGTRSQTHLARSCTASSEAVRTREPPAPARTEPRRRPENAPPRWAKPQARYCLFLPRLPATFCAASRASSPVHRHCPQCPRFTPAATRHRRRSRHRRSSSSR